MIKINKDYKNVTCVKNKIEFQKIIKERTTRDGILDLSDIYFENDRSFKEMDFQFLTNVSKIINVTGWNTSMFAETKYMFCNCPNLKQIIGLDTWDVSNIFGMNNMFSLCPELENLDGILKWKLAKGCMTNNIFKGSPKIPDDIRKMFIK